MEKNNKKILVSVVIPCLNEEKGVGVCVKKAKNAFLKMGIRGEVIVVDNGSKDRSVEVAQEAGAKVIFEEERGYGNAYLKGFKEAEGDFLIMADADDTYDLSKIDKFIEPLEERFDFVIGSRLGGKILPGSMPFLHRYLGNPFLTMMLRFLFHAEISDAYCGMRAFTRKSYNRMKIISKGMEFALEMIVKTLKLKLKVKEVPITYHPRKGESKLSPFVDSWRSIRFMLLFSPNYLFIIPGALLFLCGVILMVLFLPGTIRIFGRIWGIHSIILTSLMAIVGLQVMIIGFFAKAYALTEGFIEEDKLFKSLFREIKLETGLLIGFLFMAVGSVLNIRIFLKWSQVNFGQLDEVKMGIVALTLIAIGIQIFFSSFFMSLLNIRKIK